jgi:hypothetical protein
VLTVLLLLLLLLGLPAGFAEGAQAGYEFGLVKSTLQVFAAHLEPSDSRRTKVGWCMAHQTSSS